MPNDLQRLNSVHLRMMELDLMGKSRMAIASDLGRTPESVGMVQRSPCYQDRLSRRRRERDKAVDEATSSTSMQAQEFLEQHALTAAHNQVNLMESMDDSVRLRASESVLNRVLGVKGTESNQIQIIGNDAIQVLIDTLDQVGGSDIVASSS